jgi:anti-sigma B factor antagonist
LRVEPTASPLGACTVCVAVFRETYMVTQTFSVHVVDETTTDLRLRLCGELDLASASVLNEVLGSIEDGVRSLVLDLSELTFIDSSGISCLVRAQQEAGPKFRHLTVWGAQGHVAHVLEMTGLDQVFPLHDERENALPWG